MEVLAVALLGPKALLGAKLLECDSLFLLVVMRLEGLGGDLGPPQHTALREDYAPREVGSLRRASPPPRTSSVAGDEIRTPICGTHQM